MTDSLERIEMEKKEAADSIGTSINSPGSGKGDIVVTEILEVEVEEAVNFNSAAMTTSGSLPLVKEIAGLKYPWLLLFYEFFEIGLVAFSVVLTVGNNKISVDINKEKLVLLFISMRVSLLLQFIVGFALMFGLFAYRESVSFCVRTWVYGAYFLLFEQTLVMGLFIGFLKYFGHHSYSSAEFVVVVLVNFAAVFARFIAINFARGFLQILLRKITDYKLNDGCP